MASRARVFTGTEIACSLQVGVALLEDGSLAEPGF